MSRVGKKLIPIPSGVTVTIQDRSFMVAGPQGQLSMEVPARYLVVQEDGTLQVTPPQGTLNPAERALWGTVRALCANMVHGVTNGFERKLEIEGIGYNARSDGARLTIQAGFTHPVIIEPPQGIAITVERNVITIRGIDKQIVGQVAAKIRAIRPVEPYKGKGIRYQGEVVRRKAGKKAVGSS
jgi:large subunit ribosomal protein L6